MLSYTFKPLDAYPRELTASYERQPSPFGMTWTQTQERLEKELRMLDYREGSVVLQTAHSEYDVRKDGQLRSDVRNPEHPGVVVRFEVWDHVNRRYVPMAFECDRFFGWKDNVRAIADAMEALRKIDRYGVNGVGKTGAQYEGYKALPSAEGKITSVEVAAEFIADHSGVPAVEILSSSVAREAAYRRAAMKLHPDRGGSTDDFVKLQDAHRMLAQQL